MVDLFEKYGLNEDGPDKAPSRRSPDTSGERSRDLLAEFKPQESPQLGSLASGALGAAQGLTFGLSDEIGGAIAGAGSALAGNGYQEGYRSGTDAIRGLHDRAAPTPFLAGDIAGSLALPGGAVRAGGTLAAKAGRAAMAGAAQGAVGGAGRAEGNLAERAPEAAMGAAMGGVVGGALGAGVGALSNRTGGTRKLVDRAIGAGEEEGDRGLETLRKASRDYKTTINQAYDEVADIEGQVEGAAGYEMLQRRMTTMLDESGFLYTPGVGDEVLGTVKKIMSGLAGGKADGPGLPLGDFKASVQQLEGVRKGLNRAIGNLSADPARKAAMVAVKDTYDNWMVDTIQNGLYRGDENAIDLLKNARGLNRQYQETFGLGGRTSMDKQAGRIVQKMLDDETTAPEAVNYLFGVNGVGIQASRRAMARIRDASPEALDMLKAAHLQRILAPNGGDIDPAPVIADRMNRLLGRQPAMMKILYGDDLPGVQRLTKELGKDGAINKIAGFVTTKPWAQRMGAMGAGAIGAGVVGQDSFTGAMLAGLMSGARGVSRMSAQSIGMAASRVDRPVGATLPGRAARASTVSLGE